MSREIAEKECRERDEDRQRTLRAQRSRIVGATQRVLRGWRFTFRRVSHEAAYSSNTIATPASPGYLYIPFEMEA